jgi:alkylhydroperoxidase/carboxymuconolactone decarboxylase family protein YurZ
MIMAGYDNSIGRRGIAFTNSKGLPYNFKKEAIMVESQIELEKNRVKQRDRFGELLPGLKGALDGLKDEVYKDGALSVKIKRLMSLAIGLRAGCRSCILSQTMSALEAGATISN